MLLRCILAASALALASTAFAAPPPPPQGQRWIATPELSDEFNAGIDETKWMTHHPYAKGHWDSEFQPQNVSVSGGALHISASRVAHGDRVIGVGCLSSRTAIVGPGYYEARLRGTGLDITTAFWLQNPTTEVDVVELYGRRGRSTASVHLHAFPHGWASDISTGGNVELKRPSAEWHTYGAWWRDENSVWFYIDGQKVSELTAPRPFVTPMYLFLDMEHAHGEGHPSDRDLADPRRNTMTVDWVRAYRLAATTRRSAGGATP